MIGMVVKIGVIGMIGMVGMIGMIGVIGIIGRGQGKRSRRNERDWMSLGLEVSIKCAREVGSRRCAVSAVEMVSTDNVEQVTSRKGDEQEGC